MDISDSLTETISVKHKTAVSKEGDPTYGSVVTMKARIERFRATDVGEGTTRQDETRIFTLQAILNSDLIFLPEDSTATNDNGRRPQRTEAMKDLDGVTSHYETVL